ncbi:MAG: Chloramphenicol acetyltransferase [Chlamydiae bacterium]|nr:Chloramphenicol acetyltransferase [Chlamydiota bacterium]
MKFELIEVNSWSRKEYFKYYLNTVPCTYSMTVNLEITSLLETIKKKNIKLYPTMVYLLATIVNKHKEFRTAIDEKSDVGVFDLMYPEYTIFHKDSETFSNIWTEYSLDFSEFYNNYLIDTQKYGDVKQFSPKPNTPPNTFPISSIPWTTFTGFNLNLLKGADYLLPVFTMGKYFEQNDKILLPMSIQAHHAVCDGFHISRFVNELQEIINKFQYEVS